MISGSKALTRRINFSVARLLPKPEASHNLAFSAWSLTSALFPIFMAYFRYCSGTFSLPYAIFTSWPCFSSASARSVQMRPVLRMPQTTLINKIFITCLSYRFYIQTSVRHAQNGYVPQTVHSPFFWFILNLHPQKCEFFWSLQTTVTPPGT